MDLGSDPTLLAVVQAARAWGVSPSRFQGAKHVTHEYDASGRIVRTFVQTPEWTREDRELAFALMGYEAGLCPGGDHVLAETSKPEHEDAYRPDGPPTRCHYCTARALSAKAIEDEGDKTEGLYWSFHLDPEVVAKNLEPVPPLPPELQ